MPQVLEEYLQKRLLNGCEMFEIPVAGVFWGLGSGVHALFCWSTLDSFALSEFSDLFLQDGTARAAHYISWPSFKKQISVELVLQFPSLTTRWHIAHKEHCSFKPDGGFIFRFGGSAVVYHGKMK